MPVPTVTTQSSMLMKGEGVMSPVGDADSVLLDIGPLNEAVGKLRSPPGAVTFISMSL